MVVWQLIDSPWSASLGGLVFGVGNLPCPKRGRGGTLFMANQIRSSFNICVVKVVFFSAECSVSCFGAVVYGSC